MRRATSTSCVPTRRCTARSRSPRTVTRIILNTCWGSESDCQEEQSHETMEAMFS
ncbi:HalD/BesD family halogenase [Streptosporangium vulgare]|uniref:HalD/BesD family halogenase n=1 Tax=Streptosporangium vulgare TaxID=46190 RepID=UPI003CD0A4C1